MKKMGHILLPPLPADFSQLVPTAFIINLFIFVLLVKQVGV